MQLPIFTPDPYLNALQSPDTWVKKLSIEAAQLLATAYNDLTQAPLTATGKVRSTKSHLHHPITKWVNTSIANWHFTWDYGYSCILEAFGRQLVKTAHHLTFYEWCLDNPPILSDSGLTEFVKPIGYGNLPVFEAYQQYFCDNKQHIAVWRNRDTPEWYLNHVV